MIYPDSFAERMKSRAGQKFRPSNGTEGEIFREYFCNRCEHDRNEDCDILLRTMCFNTEAPEYPIEWQFGTDGQPTCTAFLPEGEPRPTPRCEHTVDMFGDGS
jgi:hypothetical protein